MRLYRISIASVTWAGEMVSKRAVARVAMKADLTAGLTALTRVVTRAGQMAA